MRPATSLENALLAEVAAKSDLVWVETEQRQSPLWHVWVDDQIAVVVGGGEQPDPGLREQGRVVVTLRSKDKGHRLLRVMATSHLVSPQSPPWEAVTTALAPGRLNATKANDDSPLPDRWAASSAVWLLTPTGDVLEGPGDYSSDDHRAVPTPTAATTVTHHPYHFGKATKKRRR